MIFFSILLVKHVFLNDTEGIYIDLNFKKWLLLGTQHTWSQSNQYHFDNFDRSLDTYSKYEKAKLVGLTAQTTNTI